MYLTFSVSYFLGRSQTLILQRNVNLERVMMGREDVLFPTGIGELLGIHGTHAPMPISPIVGWWSMG